MKIASETQQLPNKICSCKMTRCVFFHFIMHLEPFQSDYKIIPQLYHYNKVANNLHCLSMKIYADTSINKHTQTQPVNQSAYQVLSNP